MYWEVTKILRKNFEDRRNKNYGGTVKQKPVKPELPVKTDGIYSETIEKEILNFLLKFGSEIIEIEDADEKISVAEFIISEIKNDDLEFHNLIYKEIFQNYENYFSETAESVQDYFLKHENGKISKIAAEILGPIPELSKIWQIHGAVNNGDEKHLDELIPKLIDTFKLKIVQQKAEKLKKQLAQLQRSDTYDEQLNRLLEELTVFDSLKVQLTQILEKTALL